MLHHLKAKFTVFCVVLSSGLLAQSTITINPGDDIQSKVNSNPENTVFNLTAGVYRMQSVIPKNGDVFIGQNGAILNGSRVLSSWKKSGNYWAHGGQDQQGQQLQGGWCDPAYPRCHFPEDLFVDDVPLTHQESKQKVVSVTDWFFDQNVDSVYIRFNPEGKKIEIGVTESAFSGSSINVTLRNLIVEKYASATQKGAIGADGCIDWLIENCDVRLNHGVGIHFSGKSIVRNCKIYRNGQLGIKTRLNSDGALVENNEIYENKYAPYIYSNEGGGSKFARTNHLVIRKNYVHHNYGPGLWTDIDNVNSLYEGNVCEYNWAAGIFHEISYDATIRCNVLRYNNQKPNQMEAGNIFISNSVNCDVYNNIIVVNGEAGPNGITVKYANRPPYLSNNNSVHNNDVTFLASKGISGLNVDNGLALPTGNQFKNNSFHANNGTYTYFKWGGSKGDLTWMQSIGQEVGSKIDSDINASVKFSGCELYSDVLKPMSANDLVVFPNPFIDELNVLGQGIDDLKMYNMNGKLVIHEVCPATVIKLPSSLPSGIYILRIVRGESVVNAKLVKSN